MGAFDLPIGEVMFRIDGAWESYMFTDVYDLNEINETNKKYWHLPSGTKGVYVNNNVTKHFVLE